jgi:hypothetical protein
MALCEPRQRELLRCPTLDAVFLEQLGAHGGSDATQVAAAARLARPSSRLFSKVRCCRPEGRPRNSTISFLCEICSVLSRDFLAPAHLASNAMPTITTTRASMGVCPPPFSAPTIHSKAVCSSCAPTCAQSWSLARTFRRRPGFRSFDTLDIGSELQEGELSSSPLSKLPRNKSDPALGSLGLELEDAGAPQSLPAGVSPKQGLPLPAGGACTPEPLSPSGSLKISYPPAAERAAADGAPVVPGLMRWASLRAPLGVVPEALERTRSGASQLEVGPGGIRRDEIRCTLAGCAAC